MIKILKKCLINLHGKAIEGSLFFVFDNVMTSDIAVARTARRI